MFQEMMPMMANGGGGAKVITQVISEWNKGENLEINYAQEGLSKVDFMVAYGSRAANGTTYPFLSIWFSNMNNNGASVQQFYGAGNANIIPQSNGNTTNVGSTTQANTLGVNIISDTNGVLTLQNLGNYQPSIKNVTLIVGQFVHETS